MIPRSDWPESANSSRKLNKLATIVYKANKVEKPERVKYSIIIPVRNGANYLASSAGSVLDQDYANYELLISDNHSEDGTAQIMQSLTHPRLRKLHPPAPLSMVDHFEWTLSLAEGEWVMFLGADDGVQQYFFELAEQLTSIARSRNLRTITSRRAYIFWPGCEEAYGGSGVSFSAENVIEIKDFGMQTWRTLLGLQTYFELPQMYSNSLFKRELLIKAKRTQGRVFTSLTPDANLAAIACRLERKYLLSGVPLGWIGSSPSRQWAFNSSLFWATRN